MRVKNPSLLDLSGSPAAPAPPPTLVVMDGELTEALLAEVQTVYKQFCDQRRASVVAHLVSEKRLASGGRVRMSSIMGQDLVRVWVSSSTPEITLRHGIVVVTPWSDPCFYGRSGEAWEPLSVPVPQETLSTYAMTVKQRDGATFHLPTTLTQEQMVWDWAEHDGHEWASAKPVVPVVLDAPDGVEVGDWHAPHYAVEGQIKSADGSVLFSSAETPPIIESAPEGARWAAPDVDLLGKLVLLQHSRSNILSASANVWRHRYCVEKVRRISDAEYVSDGRSVVEIITPFSELTVNAVQIIDNSLDAEPSVEGLTLKAVDFDYANGAGTWAGYGWFDPPGVNEYYAVGLKIYDLDADARALAFRNTQAVREITRQVPGPTQVFDGVAALGGAGAHSVKVKSNLNFLRSITWRAGYDNKLYDWSSNNFGGDKWGCVKVESVRRDLSYELAGNPHVEFDLGFAPNFRAFEGTLDGVMKGKEHYDERNLVGLFNKFREYSVMSLNLWSTPPGSTPGDWYLLQSQNWKSEYVALNEQFAEGQWYSNVIERTVLEEEEPLNTGAYSYTTRYIIDLDAKSAFYVALKVEVHCSGARWEHRPDLGYRGLMEKAADPSYTVIVSVVTSWQGQPEESKELIRGTAVRPPFEFGLVQMVNPFYWPLPVASGREVLVYLPPAIQPSERMLTQLENVVRHQGVNSRVAGDCSFSGREALPEEADDLWVDGVATTISKIEAGEERPNAQMPQGVVYARTIRLSEFADAFWILSATRCDAELDGFQPIDGEERPKWHYMPDVGAAVTGGVFHVEVRDGKFIDWSDDIPAKEGSARPVPSERNIEVYVV